MTFISEAILDEISLKIAENETMLQQNVEDFDKGQPNIIGFILSDDALSLRREEREYLLYLAMVVWKSFESANVKLDVISQDQIGVAEEENWLVLNDSASKTFRDRINPYFKSYPQEDLLAFAEDALVDDDDNFISKEGREIMFVALKSIIDCFHNSIATKN